MAGPTTMDRIRNGDLGRWEVAVKPASETCRTPLTFLDMDPRTLNERAGWFHYPGGHHNTEA